MDADEWRLKQNTAFPDQSMVGKGGVFCISAVHCFGKLEAMAEGRPKLSIRLLGPNVAVLCGVQARPECV